MTERTEEHQNNEHISDGRSHSGHSGAHRHHSSSGHHHEKRSRYSQSKNKPDSIPAEYSKRKKIRIWSRSLFIAVICIIVLSLFFLIFNAGNGSNLLRSVISGQNTEKSNIEEIQKEIEVLKTENMELKYELEKYKNKYGDLNNVEEEDEKSSKSSKTTKNSSAKTAVKK